MLKKILYTLFGITLAFAGTVYAVQISVPSSSGPGFLLQSLTNGTYSPVSLTAGSNVTISTTTSNINISSTAGNFPFTVNSWGNSTTSTLGFLNGFLSTASSTISSALRLSSLAQGFLYTGSTGLVQPIASSSVNLSWFNNDAGFITTTGTYPINSIITSNASGALSATGTQLTVGNLIATTTATSTLPRLLTTNATTTSLAISGIASSLLKTNANGSIIPAIAGTDYETFDFPFTVNTGYNSTSTVIGFTSGLFSLSSTTLNGTKLSDLTQGFGYIGSNGLVSTVSTSTLAGQVFPFTSQSYGNSTSSVIGFTNGLFSTASSTFSSALRLSSLSQGSLYVGSTGLVGTTATSSVSCSGTVSCTSFNAFAASPITISGSGISSYDAWSHPLLGLSATTSQLLIGTTTASNYQLTLSSSTAPQLSLSSGSGIAQWILRNAGSTLYFSTTTVAGNATTTTSALSISGSGFGTTTLAGLNVSAQATSTSNVGFNITNGCFAISGTCLSSSTGLSSYDAWTHPLLGLSATTSQMIFGTTTASSYGLTISTTTTSQLSLGAGAGNSQWTFRNAGGNLYMSTTTVAGTSTSTTPFLAVTSCKYQFGCTGIGTSSPVSSFVVNGSILSTEAKPATSTSMIISLASSTQHVIQNGTSALTVTLTELYAGQTGRVVICNPAGGTPGAVTWATSPTGLLLWSGGTAPTQTTTVNKCDLYTFTTTQASSTSGAVKVFGGWVQNF